MRENIKPDRSMRNGKFVPSITPQQTAAQVDALLGDLSQSLAHLVIEGAALIRPIGQWKDLEDLQQGRSKSVQKLLEMLLTVCRHPNMPIAWPMSATLRFAASVGATVPSEPLCLQRAMEAETRAQAEADVLQMRALTADANSDVVELEQLRAVMALHAAAAARAIVAIESRIKSTRVARRVVRRTQLVASNS